MVDTPFFDNPSLGRARARGRRPRGHVRGLPATACRRQRAAGPPDRAGQLSWRGLRRREDDSSSGQARRTPCSAAARPATTEITRPRRPRVNCTVPAERGEDRVVLADADAVAGLEAGAALADDDLAAGHGLTGEHLDAEALGVRVAAVAARAEAFLMCHRSPPARWSLALGGRRASARLLARPRRLARGDWRLGLAAVRLGRRSVSGARPHRRLRLGFAPSTRAPRLAAGPAR